MDTEEFVAQQEFLDTLPESESVEAILMDLLDTIRRAVSLDVINVAAGIAYQRLMGRNRP